jgi:hypothetical protein
VLTRGTIHGREGELQKWHGQRAKEYGFPDGKTGGVAELHSLDLSTRCSLMVLYTPDAVFHPFAPPDAAHLEEPCRAISVRVLTIAQAAWCAEDGREAQCALGVHATGAVQR